jgi:hypothetical protein
MNFFNYSRDEAAVAVHKNVYNNVSTHLHAEHVPCVRKRLVRQQISAVGRPARITYCALCA